MRALCRTSILPLVFSAALLSGCDFVDLDLSAHARFEKTVALEPTGTFHLENVNGRVTVEPWNQKSVRIEAEKAATSEAALEDIKIEVQGEGDRVDVKTRFPRHGFLSGSGKVDYLIRLPAGARVEVRSVNGGVNVTGVEGPVEASTVNGSVRINDSAGQVRVSTVNGSIHAGYRKVVPDGNHSYSTTNGSVTLYLPSDAIGEFDAQTVNGGISTEFPLEVSGRIGRRHLHGRLGEGRARFNIHTVNGSVKVLKGGGEKVV